MSCVQSSEGDFSVVYHIGLLSRSSGVVRVPVLLEDCLHLRLQSHTQAFCTQHHACSYAPRHPAPVGTLYGQEAIADIHLPGYTRRPDDQCKVVRCHRLQER